MSKGPFSSPAYCARSLACVLACACLLAPARADVSKIFFSIQAATSDGKVASWSFDYPLQGMEVDAYTWTLPEPVVLTDSSGAYVATLTEATSGFVADPAIGLGFNVQAGPAVTDFVITSALLSFPMIATPVGRASAQIGVLDSGADGVTLTGKHAAGTAYRADYNGFVPGGTPFTNLIKGVSAGPGGVSGTSEEDPGGGLYKPIGVPVMNMSAEFRFSLTANDSANGTSIYEIIPEPGTFAMLLAGLFAAVRRTR